MSRVRTGTCACRRRLITQTAGKAGAVDGLPSTADGIEAGAAGQRQVIDRVAPGTPDEGALRDGLSDVVQTRLGTKVTSMVPEAIVPSRKATPLHDDQRKGIGDCRHDGNARGRG